MKTPEETKAAKVEYQRSYEKTAKRLAYRFRPDVKARKAETERKRRKRPGQKEKQVEYARSFRADRKDLFNLLKTERPCYDCGGVFPPEAMDWDHLPGTIKCFGVGRGIQHYTLEEVVDEIAKCQLVCANCHRIRTVKRTKQNERSPSDC